MKLSVESSVPEKEEKDVDKIELRAELIGNQAQLHALLSNQQAEIQNVASQHPAELQNLLVQHHADQQCLLAQHNAHLHSILNELREKQDNTVPNEATGDKVSAVPDSGSQHDPNEAVTISNDGDFDQLSGTVEDVWLPLVTTPGNSACDSNTECE